MIDRTGWIVRSTAGRDKDGIFCVIGADRAGGRLLLADGKRRPMARPKAKKPGHVEVLAQRPPYPAVQKLCRGEAPTDAELRRTLRAFRDEMEV